MYGRGRRCGDVEKPKHGCYTGEWLAQNAHKDFEASPGGRWQSNPQRIPWKQQVSPRRWQAKSATTRVFTSIYADAAGDPQFCYHCSASLVGSFEDYLPCWESNFTVKTVEAWKAIGRVPEILRKSTYYPLSSCARCAVPIVFAEPISGYSFKCASVTDLM